MAERTVVQAISGAVLSLSASLPATYDAAGYGATALAFTAVGQIEDHGNYGVVATITEFTPVATAVVTKVKGSKNYGKMALMLGSVPSDAGQAIGKTASESNSRFSAKLVYPVGIGEATAEIHYFEVLVSKFEYQNGSVNNVQKVAIDLDICRVPVIVDAT